MIDVGIVGGTGYAGVELLRLLARHPQARLRTITSRGESGNRVADLFPNLRGHVELEFEEPATAPLEQCDVVFTATPHGVAMGYAQALLDAGARVVDISADFRLRDVTRWESVYQRPHEAPALLEQAVYGLPELNRERIRQARLIANPGCYPTAILLALLPLLEGGLVDAGHLIADAKSGVSGAGRQAAVTTLLAEAGDNMAAYKVGAHRHGPEIVGALDDARGMEVGLVFVPHLAPMIRGIHATVYARLRDPHADLQAAFEARYRDEPFVDVLPPGAHPATRSVRGANTCRIAVHRPGGGDTVVVLSVIDNLVKGAAGQAVQNMNIACGLDERCGLDEVALLP